MVDRIAVMYAGQLVEGRRGECRHDASCPPIYQVRYWRQFLA